MRVPTTAQAVDASLACARRLGLPGDDPLVVAEGYSVRVLLRPAPVVTRVVTVGRTLRGDPLPWMQREVDVVTWLHERGAAVVPAYADPGPHRVDGLDVTLWALGTEPARAGRPGDLRGDGARAAPAPGGLPG